MSTPLLVLLGLLALGNVLVSFGILGTRRFSGSQKALQIALVWLLPVVGAIVCMAAAATLDRRRANSEGLVYAGDSGGVDGGAVDVGAHGTGCDFGGDAGGCDGGGGDGGGGGD